MRSLFIAALRLFILLELIQAFWSFIYVVAMGLSPDYRDLRATTEMLLPSVGSIALYMVVFWKAAWLADRARIAGVDTIELAVDAKTIVACGLVLFGVYGIANQFLLSLHSLYDFFVGHFSSPGSFAGWGSPILTVVYTVIRLLVYLYCIVGAGRIAQVTTRHLVAESDT